MIVPALVLQAALSAWDTGHPGAPRDQWKAIPAGERVSSFQGDAAISNGRLQVVVRADAIEVSGADGTVRARLKLGGALHSALVEHGKGGVTLEVAGAAKLRLKRGEVALQVESAGSEKLTIAAPSRFVILPDFFADDMVLDAVKLPVDSAEVPSENFVLHPVGQGEAIVLGVFENRDQEVRLRMEGTGAERRVAASEIAFGKGGKVWVGLMEGPNTWHVAEVREKDARKVMDLEWATPYPAQWRCDFTRTNDLNDSWEMLMQEKEGGEYLRWEWFDDWQRKIPSDRKRWTTVLGSFKYPCWTDHAGRGHLQPLKHEALEFRGPAVIYPINRVKRTPPETYTVVDVVRNTLGVGPCEYILDVEGQKETYAGVNTCSVRDSFKEIWKKGEQKQKGKEIEKSLDDALAFVKHVRGRIEAYRAFGKELGAHLAGAKKAHPAAAAFLGEMEQLLGELETRTAARQEKMKTPEYVAALNDGFRRDLDQMPAEKCAAYTKALTEVGDNQDELVGECRWVVKAVRQKAGLAMAADPRLAPAAAEIRARTQKILRNPSALERARH